MRRRQRRPQKCPSRGFVEGASVFLSLPYYALSRSGAYRSRSIMAS